MPIASSRRRSTQEALVYCSIETSDIPADSSSAVQAQVSPWKHPRLGLRHRTAAMHTLAAANYVAAGKSNATGSSRRVPAAPRRRPCANTRVDGAGPPSGHGGPSRTMLRTGCHGWRPSSGTSANRATRPRSRPRNRSRAIARLGHQMPSPPMPRQWMLPSMIASAA